jgi:hypothetical protein
VDFERLVAVIEQITVKMEAHPERMDANMNACRDRCRSKEDEGLRKRGRKIRKR